MSIWLRAEVIPTTNITPFSTMLMTEITTAGMVHISMSKQAKFPSDSMDFTMPPPRLATTCK